MIKLNIAHTMKSNNIGLVEARETCKKGKLYSRSITLHMLRQKILMHLSGIVVILKK